MYVMSSKHVHNFLIKRVMYFLFILHSMKMDGQHRNHSFHVFQRTEDGSQQYVSGVLNSEVFT